MSLVDSSNETIMRSLSLALFALALLRATKADCELDDEPFPEGCSLCWEGATFAFKPPKLHGFFYTVTLQAFRSGGGPYLPKRQNWASRRCEDHEQCCVERWECATYCADACLSPPTAQTHTDYANTTANTTT